jgi:ribosomal protein S18 acetylase RimI-like enzyme
MTRDYRKGQSPAEPGIALSNNHGSSAMTLTYRLALPSDRWALAWIEARSFGWGRLLGGQWLALDGRRTCGWLACDPDGRVRGYALMQRRDNRPYVPGIGVLPDWRRRGIGEQLMRLVLGAHRDVWLHAREGNLSARRLYARLGLRETMRVPLFYSDGETAIVIEAEMSAHDSRFGQQDRSV